MSPREVFSPAPKPLPKAPKQKRYPKRENYARSKKEFARCFHSVERVKWVKAQPCAWCSRALCDNAHTMNAGRSRRGHYTTIVPLCADIVDINRVGCHWLYDNHKAPFNTEESRAQVKNCAPEVERLWQESRA